MTSTQKVIVMKTKPKPKDVPQSDIPLWAGRYARNRVLPLLYWMACIFLFVTVQGLLSILLMQSHIIPLYIICISMNALITLVLLWAAITGRIRRWYERLSSKLYEHEGVAVPAPPAPMPAHGKLKSTLIMGALMIGPWLLMYTMLDAFDVPLAYLQPAMAYVLVPLLTALIMAGPDSPKWPGLLVPGLYGIHALLVLAGAPVPAFGVSYLDVFVPLFVYAMLSLTVMHLYSRYALLKLQLAVLTPMDEIAESDGEDPGNAGA
ncbi:MAG: hypothetical protein ACYC1M_14020 [Armatimonadota bacterium]